MEGRLQSYLVEKMFLQRKLMRDETRSCRTKRMLAREKRFCDLTERLIPGLVLMADPCAVEARGEEMGGDTLHSQGPKP